MHDSSRLINVEPLGNLTIKDTRAYWMRVYTNSTAISISGNATFTLGYIKLPLLTGNAKLVDVTDFDSVAKKVEFKDFRFNYTQHVDQDLATSSSLYWFHSN